MKRWLKHFLWWIRGFPIGDYHAMVSDERTDYKYSQCWVCDRWEDDDGNEIDSPITEAV